MWLVGAKCQLFALLLRGWKLLFLTADNRTLRSCSSSDGKCNYRGRQEMATGTSESACWVTIYPAYLSNKRTLKEGRRVAKSLVRLYACIQQKSTPRQYSQAIDTPLAQEIHDVCKAAGLNVELQVLLDCHWNANVAFCRRRKCIRAIKIVTRTFKVVVKCVSSMTMARR